MFRRHKERVKSFLVGGEQYKKEVKRQIRLLIIVTLGFTIAFSWRQTVFDLFQTAVQNLFRTTNSALSSFLTSSSITVVSLLFILLTAYLLQDKSNRY